MRDHSSDKSIPPKRPLGKAPLGVAPAVKGFGDRLGDRRRDGTSPARMDGVLILLYRARACFVSTLRTRTALLRFSGFGTFEASRDAARAVTIPRAEP